MSPDGRTVIVQRPRDGFKQHEFALDDMLKVKHHAFPWPWGLCSTLSTDEKDRPYVVT